MKRQITNLMAAAFVTLSACVSAQVEFGSNKLGDIAPELKVQVLKGDPVNLKEGVGKNLFIIEFWATWCGPCKFSIPHLTELQEKYREDGLVVIGISDETAATVLPYIEEMGEKMDYTVAIDLSKSTMSRYLRGYGEDAIPRAFVIDVNGRVAWVGNPLNPFMDEIVATLLEDIPKDAASYAAKDPPAQKKNDAESTND